MGNTMCATDSQGMLYLNDVQRNKLIYKEQVSNQRMGSVAWSGDILATGSRDKIIRIFDSRNSMIKPVTAFAGHLQEICGLKLSFDNNYIASGGNDNQLFVWDMR